LIEATHENCYNERKFLILKSYRFKEKTMALENKLGITHSAEFARIEAKLSKIKAIELYERDIVEEFEIGKFGVLPKFIIFYLVISMILPVK